MNLHAPIMPRRSNPISDFEAEAILTARKQGWSYRRIAQFFNKSYGAIYRLILRASGAEEEETSPIPDHFELVFPIRVFSPDAEPTPIRDGDAAVCMVSNASGLDFLGELRSPQPLAAEPTIYRPGELKGGTGI